MLEIGNKIEIEAIDLDFKGQGVSRIDNYVIFTPGLLKDEKAIVEITKLNKNFAESKLIKLITISKKRTHDSSMLGSIELYHLETNEQIKWQERITKETFSKIAQIDVKLEDTIADDRVINYRNKSVFHVMNHQTIKLGLYLKNFELTETQQFILADKVTNKFLNLINRSLIPVEKDVLTHVVFRSNEEQQILITFVSRKEQVKGLDILIKRLSEHEEVVGITINLKDHPKHILGAKSIVKYGKNEIVERLKHYELPINDRSFFQINFPVMKLVFDKINGYINNHSKIVEAYSGIGVIGLSLLEKAKEVIMIESNKENIQMAQQIIFNHRIANVILVEDKAEDVIENYDGDVLIVDPPRQGLMPTFVDKIKQMNFEQIIYVSCDVKTLARDIQLLSDLYEIKHIHPIRMFPQTISLETLVLLNKK